MTQKESQNNHFGATWGQVYVLDAPSGRFLPPSGDPNQVQIRNVAVDATTFRILAWLGLAPGSKMRPDGGPDPGIQDDLTGPHVYSRWPGALVNASEYQFAGLCDCFTGSGKFPNLIYTRSGSTLIAIQ